MSLKQVITDLDREVFSWVLSNQNQSNHPSQLHKDSDNTENQSKLEAITCSWRKPRKNACEGATTSDWMKKWREFFKPIV